MADFVYSGGVRFDDEAVADVTMDKDGHPLTCKNPITGEELGGGGSSDFSTAKVTLNFPFEGRVTSTTQVAQYFSMGGEIIGAICDELTIKGPGSATPYLILYKENLIGELSFDENVTVSVVSGNAEVEEGRYVHIHGNCELLINRPQ